MFIVLGVSTLRVRQMYNLNINTLIMECVSYLGHKSRCMENTPSDHRELARIK